MDLASPFLKKLISPFLFLLSWKLKFYSPAGQKPLCLQFMYSQNTYIISLVPVLHFNFSQIINV